MATSIARGTPRAQAAKAFMSTKSRHVAFPRVAVLYQALDPPLINGTRKPKKPGGEVHEISKYAHFLTKSRVRRFGRRYRLRAPT